MEELKKKLKKYSSFMGQLDKPTITHCKNVAEVCKYLAENLGLDMEVAYTAGYLHDAGKLYVPSRILNKNSGLSTLERQIVNLHAYYGYELIKEIEDDDRLYLSALYHHGFDKPSLSPVTETVSDEAREYIRVVHCADIYDALTMNRVYHEPFSAEQIFNILLTDESCSEQIRTLICEYDATHRVA